MTNAEVSLREIYDTVLEIRSDVTALKSAGTAKAVEDHEGRIRKLEAWIWRASGIAAVGGAVAGWGLPTLIG